MSGKGCTGSRCSHSFTVDGRDDNVVFNTPYEITIDITAINTCGMESSPATGMGTLEYVAHGEDTTSV